MSTTLSTSPSTSQGVQPGRREPPGAVARARPGSAELASAARAGVQRAVEHLATLQADDGHWPGDYGGPLFLLPGLLIAQHVTDAPISDYRRQRMISYLCSVQNDDGGWGLHIEDRSTVFGTALNYVALRILGVPADNPRAAGARQRLHALGGAESIPTWGKFWLAVLGVYRWEGVPPLPPELWLLPRRLPFHPGRWWCHTRAVFLPMSYLAGRRFRAPETALVRRLRGELFVAPYEGLDWPALRGRVAESDIYTPHTRLLDALNQVLALLEARPLPALRRRALDFVHDQICAEDEATGYLDIGPVSKAIHLVIAWLDEREGRRPGAFCRHLERVSDYLWDGVDGMKMQGYNGSQLWDTAFTAQALLDSGLAMRQRSQQQGGLIDDVLQRAHRFIDENQVRRDVPDRERYFRDATRGAWPFSTAEQAWPVSDCTAEGLRVALLMEELAERPLSGGRMLEAVDVLLAGQNPDGGWSEYERARAGRWLELLNAAEVFGDIMIAYSYTEPTSACIQGLAAARRRFSHYRTAEIGRAIARGADFLRARQRDDGSWYGGWGICFSYGTWFGIEGLLAAGEPPDSGRIGRAARFLLEHQRGDGGWAESYRSCIDKRWIDHGEAQVVQTAWALLGLMAADEAGIAVDADAPGALRRAIERGVALLLDRQRTDGGWHQEAISGVFNRNCMIHYDNYRNIFPTWALGRYGRLYRCEPTGDGGRSRR